MARSLRNFSSKVKRLAYDRCGGRCEFVWPEGPCGATLMPGRTTYDHRIPWWISRDSSLENCQLLCRRCDSVKTPADQATIAKVRAMADKHRGIKGPGKGERPMAGGRAAKSRLKRKVGGGVVERTTQTEEHARVMAEMFGGMAR